MLTGVSEELAAPERVHRWLRRRSRECKAGPPLPACQERSLWLLCETLVPGIPTGTRKWLGGCCNLGDKKWGAGIQGEALSLCRGGRVYLRNAQDQGFVLL